jgi:amino acid permease
MEGDLRLSSPLLHHHDDAESVTTGGSGNYFRPIHPIPNYNATTESLNYSCTVPLHANGEHGSHDGDEDDDDAAGAEFVVSSSPKTSSASTFIHLLKGYVGPGCLSLPWAVSQMGYLGGTLAIALVSFWTSYNCYTIVKIKRYIERSNNDAIDNNNENRGMKKSSSAISLASSALTYPDIGEWAFGETFEQFISMAVCVQQLSVCTVFFSFIGENIHAVGQLIPGHVPVLLSSHVGVMTVALPFIMALTFIRSLKALTPVMVIATILLFVGFGLIGYTIFAVWANRPREDVEMQWTSIPLAVCAVLYSYEGICLILPIQSAMKHPRHFKRVFGSAMTIVAVIFVLFANICVYAFGTVDNGSITAFLLKKYKDDNNLILFVMAANTVVSISVLFTYPLQLFPTIELIGPKFSKLVWKLTHRGEVDNHEDNNFDEYDLTGFERMPPLPEHEEASLSSHDNARISEYNTNQIYGGFEESNNNESKDDIRTSLISNITEALSEQIMGDSLFMRMILVFGTYLVAVIIPNVQALISLAGALAGSSTALLIPPILELALIEHLETLGDVTISPGPPSRQSNPRPSLLSRLCSVSGKKGNKKFRNKRIKCIFLFWLGFVFLVIGSYASVSDIVRLWLTKE